MAQVQLGCAGERTGHGWGLQSAKEGGGGGRDMVAVAVWRGQRWQHREGEGGGMEKAAHVEGGWAAWVACQCGFMRTVLRSR